MKEGQVFKLKAGQEQAGLPEEITITKIEAEAVYISSKDGNWESTELIVNTFYEVKEEFNLETMPKLTIDALDEIGALIEAFVTTQNPMAGLQAKIKLTNLKEEIAKVSGLKKAEEALSLLGKKVI